MFYRITLLAISLFFIRIEGYTQEYKKSENPNEINSLLSENAKQVNDLKGVFVQTKHIGSLNIQVESKGSFLYKKQGSKILWEYISPTQSSMVFINGEFHIRQQDNVSANSNKQNAIFSELNTIILNSLSGNLVNTKGFNKDFFESQNRYLIQLRPNSSELSQFLIKLEIYFNKTDYRVSEVKLYEVGNDITSISFTNLQTNPNLSDSLFKFE